MRWKVMHHFDDVNETKVNEVSKHKTYKEAVESKNRLNEYISSYEIYYVEEIK